MPTLLFMIDLEQVRKVALLARLELTDAEEQQFTKQLSGILDYVDQLNELNTDDIEPTTRAIELSNITREDELEPFTARESILGIAPDREDDFFKVPKIL
ncbi:MAG: Asp-tRNA(Asn)/Glu-tRNA(Gln) amidotransferase subunit GatC [Leptolyngbyaceae cyanobacterium]